MREKKLAFNLKEGVFYNGIEGFIIRVGKKEKDGNTIREVMVYDHTKRMGNVSLTTAEWGKMELSPDKRFLVFRLYNGINYEERVDLRGNEISRPFQRTKFTQQYQMFDLSAFQLTRTDENLFKNNFEMQNINQLSFSIDSIKVQLAAEQESYQKNFISTMQFYKTLDTTYKKPVDSTMRFYSSIIVNFKAANRFKVLEAAKNASLSAKQNLSTSHESLNNRSKLIYKHQIVYHKKFAFFHCLFPAVLYRGAPGSHYKERRTGHARCDLHPLFHFVLGHFIRRGEICRRRGRSCLAGDMVCLSSTPAHRTVPDAKIHQRCFAARCGCLGAFL